MARKKSSALSFLLKEIWGSNAFFVHCTKNTLADRLTFLVCLHYHHCNQPL